MISVKLFGGIGNQIWQYGIALLHAKRFNTELKINTDILINTPANWTKYNYELGCFEGVTEQIDNNSYNLQTVKDGQIINDNCIMDGYWQNIAFLKDIEDELRNRLIFKNKINIPDGELICVHARRGDYLNGNYFVDLSKTDYYEKAINYIKEKVKDPIFIIFSNDEVWAEKHFSYLNDKIILQPDSPDVDLQKMSLCKYNITANSTYSFWGAWLNKNPGKIIIQPKQWYTGREYNDLYMKESILL